MTAVWPRGDGALKPALSAPSLLTADPRTTPYGAGCASASPRRRSTMAMTPDPPIVPLAAASKGRQHPSGETIPPRTCCDPACGSRSEAATTTAWSQSPLLSDCTARCIATREEEQAVETLIAGPRRPRR